MRRCLVVGSLIYVVPLFAAAPPEPPKVTVVVPLGIAPGVKTRLIIRGLRLDSATEVRCQEPKATAKLLKKSNVGVANPQDVNRLGNTQVEAEVTLPPDYPNRTVTVSVVTPSGESPAQQLLVERAPVLDEKEPNNSFRQAQAITLPQEVQGRIDPAKDVDLFRFEGKVGQRLTIDVFAARYGSPLDALLTLYDDEGRILASADDSSDNADPRLEATLPKDGAYHIGVSDANDEGGPTHLYRLRVRINKR